MTHELNPIQVQELLTPACIRKQAQEILAFTQAGKGHFKFHPEKLTEVVALVLKITKENYPSLAIPFHSRWRHFTVGSFDRIQLLETKIQLGTHPKDEKEVARIKIDLVIPSVLLDAGAGADWKFYESLSQKDYSRSEGLGVASFHWFYDGGFSRDPKKLETHSDRLSQLTEAEFEKAFQVSSQNPILGAKGRLNLLTALSKALQNQTYFKNARPGNLIDYLEEQYGKTIPAPAILKAILESLGSIWPGRLSVQGQSLGDVWKHSMLSKNLFHSLVPFHKLSQWLTYSLIEPIEEAGFKVTDVNQLTGLAEYRNGGLMLDSGLLSLKNLELENHMHAPESDLIIEWRALTIALLDQIAMQVQTHLNQTAQDFPLAKVLEGGTWWAGRFLAQQKRKDGSPPLQLKSDGTVF